MIRPTKAAVLVSGINKTLRLDEHWMTKLLVLDTRQGNYNADTLALDTQQGNYNADTPWIRPWRLLSSIHAGQVLLT